MLTELKQRQIAESLNRKGATRPCERCGQNVFEIIADGYLRHDFEQEENESFADRPRIPTAAIGCQNCGNISFFALKTLLPNDVETAEERLNGKA